ncbi:MAG TPA: glycosyltransferase family A protein [Solirubrobacteraceae bacterium]
MTPPASIVIPTRSRPDYLEVALSSIAPQADDAGAEVLVIDDAGPSPPTRALVERLGARYEPHPGPLGLNVARNTGVERSIGELVVFVDDDVRVRPGWLRALLDAAREHADVDVFTGPIEPCLEGGGSGGGAWGRIHACGREGPPITSLRLGARDADTRYAWGANMAIRRSALRRVGPFEVALEYGGDEQEWQDRLRAGAPSARVLYVAAAALEHRRAGADARLRSLARAAYARGRASRRFDGFRGETGGRVPSRGRELLTLGGCLGHVLRRRCPAGLVSVAHSAGRLRESLREQPNARSPEMSAATAAMTNPADESHAGDADPRDDFLSGASGTVGGVDAIRRGMHDEAVNAWELASGRRLRLEIVARRDPPRRKVLVLGVERPEHRALAQRIRQELLRSRHEVELHFGGHGDLGKFENLNWMLAEQEVGSIGAGGADVPAIADHDWLLLVDDDIELPRGFLDRFLFLAERFSLDLAQPAHRLLSHAAWSVTRRRPFSVVRETPSVEIGPVTAFARRTFSTLLPFPDLRMGWGLDAHWAALAREHGWRCGVLDAVSIRHRIAPAASAYSREAALFEARAFLAQRPYLPACEIQRTLVTHRRWR